MFCEKCGSEIKEGAKFCAKCGAKVETARAKEDTVVSSDRPAAEKKTVKQRKTSGKNKKIVFAVTAAVLIVAIAAVGLIGYNIVGLTAKRNKLAEAIDSSKTEEYIARKDSLVGRWKGLGAGEVSEKKNILEELQNVKHDADVFADCKKQLKTMENEKENYKLDTESYLAYTEALENCEKAIEEKRASEAVELFDEAGNALEELIEANEAYISERIKVYEAIDLSEAEEDVKAGYDTNMAAIQKLSETKDYAAYEDAFQKMDEAVYQYIEPKHTLDVTVQQIDASAFPKVKLYLSVKDSDTEAVPENLESSLFYIRKEDANAGFVKQVVSNVNQLNEEEALKIDMVADVSGSMQGTPLNEAKKIMSNFINSVQFDAGDMVELTSFSTGVRLEEEFTGDAGLLIRDINNLYTDDMTSLYDALYTSVERVAAQTGARCVIAFTDGKDNYSNCSMDDVVNIANRYHIPVFIIGIGDVDYSGAASIAEKTGGAFYSVNDVNAMESIYDKIYRMEKELYLMEYEDATGAAINDTANIQVGYRSLEYGGECTYSYTPNTLIRAGSATLYTDGPEAVVEKYMKNFASAVTYSDFSKIEDCLQPGSKIYQSQQKYVQNNISEQLDSYEIVSTDYSNADNCVVTTRETYYVQIKNKPLQLMTQQCQYAVQKFGDNWKMTDFAGKVNVLSRINQ